MQRYIENPLLVGGKKFDLRLYVLVTSYAPLTVYMYRSGFARFSLYRYNTDASSLGDTFVHLTNAAVQKTAPGFDAGSGSKWPLHAFKLYLVAKFGSRATDRCFASVEQLVIHSLLSVQKIMIHDKHCFEMYGYDILIDDALKPWLIEVNASPSISADTPQEITIEGWMDGWMDGWVDGWMGGSVNGWVGWIGWQNRLGKSRAWASHVYKQAGLRPQVRLARRPLLDHRRGGEAGRRAPANHGRLRPHLRQRRARAAWEAVLLHEPAGQLPAPDKNKYAPSLRGEKHPARVMHGKVE